MERRNVGILGATGMVGQRFIQLLEHHPWFNITWLAASDRSAGKTYAEACAWRLDTPLPARIAQMVLQPNTPEASTSEIPRIIFSSIDAPIARELEPPLRCRRLRRYLQLLRLPHGARRPPRRSRGQRRPPRPHRAAANPQAIGRLHRHQSKLLRHRLVLPLAPLEARFGIDKLFVSTMQAVSGAGYPGVASLDILGNVIPYIKNEEEKLQEEVAKLLGAASTSGFAPAPLTLSAHCNRVAVIDGHTECVSIKLRKPATAVEIRAAWVDFQPLHGRGLDGLHLPSAPLFPVEYAPKTLAPSRA